MFLQNCFWHNLIVCKLLRAILVTEKLLILNIVVAFMSLEIANQLLSNL